MDGVRIDLALTFLKGRMANYMDFLTQITQKFTMSIIRVSSARWSSRFSSSFLRNLSVLFGDKDMSPIRAIKGWPALKLYPECKN